MSSKMDRAGVRTPAQLEQKYALGKLDKSFAQAMGVAEDARETAQKANKEIENMFAKDITMTGTFTNTVETFINPGTEERNTILMHLNGESIIPDELIPYYDFDGDGKITSSDSLLAYMASFDIIDLSDFPGARTTPLTITIDLKNPKRAICFAGKNMWGREINSYYGLNFTNAKSYSAEQRINELEDKFDQQDDDYSVHTFGGVTFEAHFCRKGNSTTLTLSAKTSDPAQAVQNVYLIPIPEGFLPAESTETGECPTNFLCARAGYSTYNLGALSLVSQQSVEIYYDFISHTPGENWYLGASMMWIN